jgi:hypothetical protein
MRHLNLTMQRHALIITGRLSMILDIEWHIFLCTSVSSVGSTLVFELT